MTNRNTLALLAFSLIGGCATGRDYVYRPSAPRMADVDGFAAAVYPIPPERPEGEVRVVSFGVTELQSGPGAPVPMLQARVVIANNGDAVPWTLKTTDVSLEIPGEGRSPAMYANTDQGSVPVVTVGRGDRRTVDFYFPLPGPVRGPEGLAGFDLKWEIQTGARVVAERTAFQRVEIREEVATPTHAAVFIGWGPFWWAHPYHRHYYVHPPVVVGPHVHRRVVIVRHPRRVYVAPAR
jgi:hypothetical protein